MTTTVTDLLDNPLPADPIDGLVHVDEGEQFKVSLQATIPISEAFIAGVLAITPISSMDANRVFVSLPPPDGTTGPNLDLTYSPGTVTIATDESGDGVPDTPVPGGVALPSPVVSGTFTATGDGGTTIAFELNDAVPDSAEAIAAGGTSNWAASGGKASVIELDLTVLGAVKLEFNCQDGGLTLYPGPDGIFGDPLIPGDPNGADDFYDEPFIPNEPFLQVGVDEPPTPTANISAITGQLVTDAARAGNEITFGGPNWAASAAIDVELCDVLETACSSSEVTGVSASIDGSGVLSGTAIVDPSATTGARLLRVSTDQGESDADTVLILGAPTLTAPGNAGEGSPIQITGTNWNPGSSTTSLGLLTDPDGIPGNGDELPLAVVPLTVSSTGSFSTTQTVVADLGLLAVGEQGLGYPAPGDPGSLFAISPFLVADDNCTVGGSQDWASTGIKTGSSCSIQQSLLLDVLPGTLSMSQDGGIVDLGDLQLNGLAQNVTGDINEVTVVDATGSLLGWDLTGTMTDFTTGDGVGNKTIPAGNMEWSPDCDAIDFDGDGTVDGDGSEVISGPVAAMDNTVANELCTAAAGGGGGIFTGNAGLDLFVPANVAAGPYTATLVLLLM